MSIFVPPKINMIQIIFSKDETQIQIQKEGNIIISNNPKI